jgi:CRISPR/Cas system-associated exonuclease Cas4 (RecB family)
MNNNIILPKGYLSYSQYQMWVNSRDRYIKKYMDGRMDMDVYNKSLEYGKIVADALEKEEEVGDILTDTMMFMLPKYDVRDRGDEVEFETSNGVLRLLFKPDTFNSKTYDFREYKTGKTKWTQQKANNHFQLKFYALCIFLKYKHITEYTYLDWIETVEENGKIEPTGKLLSFKVKIGKDVILDTLRKVVKVAKDIESVYLTHEKKPLLW